MAPKRALITGAPDRVETLSKIFEAAGDALIRDQDPSEGVERADILGGVIHEYRQAA